MRVGALGVWSVTVLLLLVVSVSCKKQDKINNKKTSMTSAVCDKCKLRKNVMSKSDKPDLTALAKSVQVEKQECRRLNHKTLKCQRLKLYKWVMRRLEDSMKRLSPWVELVQNPELGNRNNTTEFRNSVEMSGWPESAVSNLIEKWGQPTEKYLLEKYKDLAKSSELKVQVPSLFELRLSPRTHTASVGRSSPRFFWDPGFNLKLKFPFFKDELKVAISTGPSFLAGIGTGIVLLIIKSMMAPFFLGAKYMIYNLFWKDGSPWDMMKMALYGSQYPEPWESAAPPPAIEHYEPPMVGNHFDNMRGEPFGPPPPSGFGHGFHGPSGPDQKLQFSQLNPAILQGLQQGRRQHFKSLLTGPSGNGLSGPFSGEKTYTPSNALQAEVENYDPFYSPLLSRIDSIFTHLGYHEEGCRERVVCSIYKFPVKYAPYSNLLSAQLSKHQSELKRPVTKSPRILRYFKYMKAAKDGQGQANCIETYPNCDQDTDSVTNLPMITTFNQLSELMGAESGATGPTA